MIKKEWVIWIAIGLLTLGLVISLVLISQTPEQPGKTNGETIGSGTEGVTDPSAETTIPEQTQDTQRPDQTIPDETTEGTQPEETNPEDTQPEEETQPNQEETEPTGNGFGEREEPTVPTQPDQPDVTDPPEETQPEETEPEETQPEETKPEESQPGDDGTMTYKEYLDLTTEEQIAFQNTFPSRKAFRDWFVAAKQEYEDSQHHITLGPGSDVNIGDYLP